MLRIHTPRPAVLPPFPPTRTPVDVAPNPVHTPPTPTQLSDIPVLDPESLIGTRALVLVLGLVSVSVGQPRGLALRVFVHSHRSLRTFISSFTIGPSYQFVPLTRLESATRCLLVVQYIIHALRLRRRTTASRTANSTSTLRSRFPPSPRDNHDHSSIAPMPMTQFEMVPVFIYLYLVRALTVPLRFHILVFINILQYHTNIYSLVILYVSIALAAPSTDFVVLVLLYVFRRICIFLYEFED